MEGHSALQMQAFRSGPEAVHKTGDFEGRSERPTEPQTDRSQVPIAILRKLLGLSLNHVQCVAV